MRSADRSTSSPSPARVRSSSSVSRSSDHPSRPVEKLPEKLHRWIGPYEPVRDPRLAGQLRSFHPAPLRFRPLQTRTDRRHEWMFEFLEIAPRQFDTLLVRAGTDEHP